MNRKLRPCANCDQPTKRAFCDGCYALVPVADKRRIRAHFRLGSIRTAVEIGRDAIAATLALAAAGGVRMERGGA